jgi:holo-[acyl-carrier protein] synthase
MTSSDSHGPIRLGIDLCATATIAEALDGPMADAYLRRVYTEREVRQSRTARGIDAARLAACFAAKEATIKVLPAGTPIPLRSIELVRAADGSATVQLSGAADELFRNERLTSLSVSVATGGDYAVAAVVAD